MSRVPFDFFQLCHMLQPSFHIFLFYWALLNHQKKVTELSVLNTKPPSCMIADSLEVTALTHIGLS